MNYYKPIATAVSTRKSAPSGRTGTTSSRSSSRPRADSGT